LDQQFSSIFSTHLNLTSPHKVSSSKKDEERSICLYNEDKSKCGSNPRPIKFSQLESIMNSTEYLELDSVYIAESLTFDLCTMFDSSFRIFRILQNTIDIDPDVFVSTQVYTFDESAKLTIKINNELQVLSLICDPNYVSVEVTNDPDIQLALIISEWLVPTFRNTVQLGDLSIFRVIGVDPKVQKTYDFGNIQSPNIEYFIFNDENSNDPIPISVKARDSVQIGQVTLPATGENVDFILNHKQPIRLTQSGFELGMRIGVFVYGGAQIIFDDSWNKLTDQVFDLDETDMIPAVFYSSLETLPFFLNEPEIKFDIKPYEEFNVRNVQKAIETSSKQSSNAYHFSWIYACVFGSISLCVIIVLILIKSKHEEST